MRRDESDFGFQVLTTAVSDVLKMGPSVSRIGVVNWTPIKTMALPNSNILPKIITIHIDVRSSSRNCSSFSSASSASRP